MYAGGVLVGLVLVSVPASSAYLLAQRGLTGEQYGAVFIAQLLAAIIGALLAGPVVRRWSLKAMFLVMLACFIGSQFALAACASVDAPLVQPLLLVCLGLFGFGFGFGGGPLNGLVAAAFPRTADAAITALHFMAGVGLMIGPLYFRQLERLGLWPLAPLVLAGAAAAVLLLAWSARVAESSASAGASGGSPSRSAYFWLMIAVAFCYALVEGSFSNWAVIFATAEKGESADVGARALAVFWGALTVGRLLVTLSLRRVPAFGIWAALPVMMVSAYLLVARVAGPTQIVLGFAVAGLACSAFFPLTVAITSKPFAAHTSWIASMLTASLMLGVGVGAYVIGSLANSIGIANLYRYMTVLPILTLALMLVGRRGTRT